MASAQSSLVLSVSPTLFEMSAAPSQTWSSSVRVINANTFPITVYLDAVNFAPSDESGVGTLVPVLASEPAGGTLAQWMDLSMAEVTIPAEQTLSIPFTITVPADAPPGGHFAAVLVGTKSLNNNDGQANVETSQVVTSLVFLRVAGEIIEQGLVRDFTTTQRIYEQADATFNVRFENTGNVHIRPQGDIEIRNMWGQERGRIPINKASQFGNVLPDSIRTYRYHWTTNWSVADIGRHSATVTLAYGDKTRQFVDATTYFWVIPWKLLLLTMLALAGFVGLIVWGVKLYVRRMLQLAGITPGLQREHTRTSSRRTSVVAPIEAGILDLRSQLRNGTGSLLARLWSFILMYRAFALVLAAIVIFVALLGWYAFLVIKNDFTYEVHYEQADGTTISVSDDVQLGPSAAAMTDEQQTITVINHSGDATLVAQLESKLADLPYTIVEQTEPFDQPRAKSVLVYHPQYLWVVEQLREALPDVLVSSYDSNDANQSPLVLYIGTDLLE